MATLSALVSGLEAELRRLGCKDSTLVWYRGCWRRMHKHFASSYPGHPASLENGTPVGQIADIPGHQSVQSTGASKIIAGTALQVRAGPGRASA